MSPAMVLPPPVPSPATVPISPAMLPKIEGPGVVSVSLELPEVLLLVAPLVVPLADVVLPFNELRSCWPRDAPFCWI